MFLVIGISASDMLLEMIGLLMKPVFSVSWETSEFIPHSQEGCCLSELSQPWIPGSQTWAAWQPLFCPSQPHPTPGFFPQLWMPHTRRLSWSTGASEHPSCFWGAGRETQLNVTEGVQSGLSWVG